MKRFILKEAIRIKTGTGEVCSFKIPRLYQGEYRNFLQKLKDDRMNVLLEAPGKPRTTGRFSQGNHLNGHIAQICEDTGNDFEDVKLYIKRKAVAHGLRLKTKDDGGIVYSVNDGEPIPISEADMTTEECGWCIDECHILAMELKIILVEE